MYTLGRVACVQHTGVVTAGTQTFEDSVALVRAQIEMRRVTGWFAVQCAASIAVGVPLAIWQQRSLWVPLCMCLLLSACALYAIRRLNRLQQRVWRVSISSRHISTLEVSRRQRLVGWSVVERVEVSDAGLVVVVTSRGRSAETLTLPADFDVYTSASQRALSVAQRWDVPIWVDGQPLALLPLSSVFPDVHDVLAASPAR